ncbi:MAG: hypothetical protein FJ318_05510 [SAR202 cluster bacterium]|nr:hypothetical protein [SAR202 cluster bacterium]
MRLTAPAALNAVACAGIAAASDPGAVTLHVDQIEGPAEVHTVHLTLATALRGLGVSFISTADADGDGLLSDETPRNHSVAVSYLDSTQLVNDLAWTVTPLGRDDGDDVLEADEKFVLNISLRALDPTPVGGMPINLTIRPNDGAFLGIEKRTLSSITPSMLLR